MWGFMCRRRGFLYPVFVMCGMAAFLDVPKKKMETADSVVFYRCSTYFSFWLIKRSNQYTRIFISSDILRAFKTRDSYVLYRVQSSRRSRKLKTSSYARLITR